MDTIMNFLNTMFMNLPDTQEVLRAKSELAAMMEDKYSELKLEGKTENEAVGIVISEFGNLEELADELGIAEYMNQDTVKSQRGRVVDLDEAKSYIQESIKSAKRIGFGVFLCILSPVMIILLSGMSDNDYGVSEGMTISIGITALLILVAVAVAVFITTGIRMERFEYIQKEVIHMDYSVEAYVKSEKEMYRGKFAVGISVGVILCILGILPVIIISSISSNEMLELICVAVLLFIVACAVYIFIQVGTRDGSYQALLQEGDYRVEKKEDTVTGAVASIYWPIVVCLYLGYSFITMDWGRSWIIWPISGILFGGIAAAISMVKKTDCK